jgi:Lrp/AsnC family leucine-responsive transcriptional regulator
VIDPAAIGRSLRVLVGVRILRHARTDVVAFERAVVKLPEVRYAYHVAGNYDYILHVEVADLPAYENFHANRLANLPSVAAVTSYVTMKTLPTATT